VAISTDDRVAVHELIALHGHLVDTGQLERLSEVFTDDVVYDLTPMSGPALHGVQAISEAAQRLGDRNPVAHLVTNTVVTAEGERVVARSKFLGVQRDGTVGSGVYNDELRRTPEGWRISLRSVSLRREPLQP
jgi:3-phenylpropionate/cinnamic acid dioxygenase small subunit